MDRKDKAFLDMSYKKREKIIKTTINDYVEAVSSSNESVDEFINNLLAETNVNTNLNENLSLQNDLSDTESTNNLNDMQLDVYSEGIQSVESEEQTLEDPFLQDLLESCERGYESDESDCDDKGEILASKLRDMVQDGHLNVTVTNLVLKAIRDCEFDICLPKNYNQLMSVPLKTKQPTLVEGGNYIHMGIQENFKFINDPSVLEMDEILVDVSFDGIPCFSSSSKQVWVISAGIVNKRIEPLIIGVYVGETKPANPGEFFYLTLHEIEQLKEQGVEVGAEKIKKPFKTRAMIGDTPARCLATGALGHAGKSSCPVCTQLAVMIGHYTVFSKFVGNLRTNESFRSREDQDYNKYDSIFTNYPSYDLVMDFPTDALHLMDLGVIKKLLTLWCTQRNLITKKNLEEVSEFMIKLKDYIPSDMGRKPRSLKDRKHFKGTEYKNLGLYIGMVVLKDKFKDTIEGNKLYEHFLCFVVAYRLLLMHTDFKVPEQQIQLANKLLQIFVQNFQNLYGQKFLCFNIHMLLHLCLFVKKFGSLDSFSSYRFENMYQRIKKRMRKATKLPQQLYNRWIEFRGMSRDTKFDRTIYSAKAPDNCVTLTDGKIVLISKKIVTAGLQEFEGSYFIQKTRFFERPIDSSVLGIFEVNLDDITETAYRFTENDIKYKNILLPTFSDNKAVIMPILHYL